MAKTKPKGEARTDHALKIIQANDGITVAEIAKAMKIKPHYLYRLLGDLETEGKVLKENRQYFAQLELEIDNDRAAGVHTPADPEGSYSPRGEGRGGGREGRLLDRPGNGHPESGKVKSVKLHAADLQVLDQVRSLDRSHWINWRAGLDPRERWYPEWKAPTDSEIIRHLIREAGKRMNKPKPKPKSKKSRQRSLSKSKAGSK